MIAHRKRRVLFLGLALSLVLVLTAQRAQAALGETRDSVESDREKLTAVRGVVTDHRDYTVHEIKTASTALREYVTPAGVVFAIAWNGLVHPDLTELLGSYAEEYREALRKSPRKHGRRHLRVKSDRVVVEKWGHIRDLKGRAYAPDLIPAGVSIDAIK